jgi:hypothetical protein
MPIARSNTSVSNRSSSLLLNATRTGGLIHAFLSVLNTSSYFLVYLKGVSFFVSTISSITIFKKFYINYLLKLINPKKACISFIVFSIS